MSSQSGKKKIPGTLVLNWQPPETQPSKPLIRRPMTACEACRSAKVKCNGQRTCERCRNRGLHCSYVPPSNPQNEKGDGARNRNGSTGYQSTLAKSPSSIQAMPTTSLSTNQTRSDPMSVDLTDNPFSIPDHSSGMLPLTQTNSGLEQWGEETFNHALEEFDWVFPGSDLSLNVSPQRKFELICVNTKCQANWGYKSK